MSSRSSRTIKTENGVVFNSKYVFQPYNHFIESLEELSKLRNIYIFTGPEKIINHNNDLTRIMTDKQTVTINKYDRGTSIKIIVKVSEFTSHLRRIELPRYCY